MKDKGASIIETKERIQREIDSRLEIERLEERLESIALGPSASVLKEKHVQHVCAKEKQITDTKYRPYKSLKSPAKSWHEAHAHESVDVTAASEPKMLHEPAIVIPLGESLVLQDRQSHKLKVKPERIYACFPLICGVLGGTHATVYEDWKS